MSDLETGPEKMWGAPAIAKATALSTDAIYRLADHPDAPIYRPPGTNRLFALRSELKVWLRTKPKIPQ
jgi:hypothetical protein